MRSRTAPPRSSDGNPERLAADVEAGILDRRDGVRREPARRRPGARVERGVDAGDCTGILPDERRTKAVDQGGHALAAALVELGPAGESLGGGDLQAGTGGPAAVGVEILELDDLHMLPRVFPRSRR